LAHLTYCRVCKQDYRCDKPGERRTSCFDDGDYHFCGPCPNVECRESTVAAETLRRLRANRCEECGNLGTVSDVGGEYFCPSGCEASRLLQREHDAFLRFVPQS
jgi:hypothetical protein